MFLLGLIAYAVVFDFAAIQSYGPASLHSWRQADGVAMAYRYYLDGMDFFRPATFYSTATNQGEAAAEFPLLYYLAAAIYHLTGPDPAVLRWLHFGVFALGLYAFGRFLLAWWGNVFYALWVPALLLGCPLLAFYSFNYLPNVTGLAYLLMVPLAWYHYVRTRRTGWLLTALGLALLAGCTKPTLLVPFLAWLTLGSAVQFVDGPSARWFPRGPQWWIALGGWLLLFVGWFVYVRWYNAHHGSPVFLANIRPIWDMAADQVQYTWYYMTERHPERYYHSAMFWALLGGSSLLYGRSFGWPNYRRWLFYATLLGTLAVLLLFFRQFLGHAYYFIDLLPFFVLVWVLSLDELRLRFPRVFHHPLLFVPLLYFGWINLQFAHRHVTTHWSQAGELRYLHTDLRDGEDLRRYVAGLGLRYPDDRIAVVGDGAPNFVLSYLGLRGVAETFGPLRAPQLDKLADQGTHYAVVTRPGLLTDPGLRPVLTDSLGTYGDSLYFFRLSVRPAD